MAVNGQKLKGPLRKLKPDCPSGDLTSGDLPVRDISHTGSKLEQFADVVLNVAVDASVAFWDNTVYNFCAQAKYRELPGPFRFKSEPTVPYSLQIFMLPSKNPPDDEQPYFHVLRHIYLQRNKLSSKDCMHLCQGSPLRFDWSSYARIGLMALTLMQDRLGGKQMRIRHLSPKFEKKLTMDQLAREDGYRFIRDCGSRSNNRNQFMEWANEQVHMPGGKLEGWQEGKVGEALNNYYDLRILAFDIEILRGLVPG